MLKLTESCDNRVLYVNPHIVDYIKTATEEDMKDGVNAYVHIRDYDEVIYAKESAQELSEQFDYNMRHQ